MPQVEIKYSKVVTVQDMSNPDQYGKVTIKADGAEYKIGEKSWPRCKESVVPGMRVKLNFANYMNKDYIFSASPVEAEGLASPDYPVTVPFEGKDVVKETPVSPSVEKPRISESKNRSYALSYTKDLVTSGKIEVDKILEWAEVLVGWLDGVGGTIPQKEAPPAKVVSDSIPKQEPTQPELVGEPITEAQVKAIAATAKGKGITSAALKFYMAANYNADDPHQLSKTQARSLIEAMNTGKIKVE